MKSLFILGTRGIPARHGGFETFAERLSLFLVSRGWKVTVYCQEDVGTKKWQSVWCGVDRIHIPIKSSGALGTIAFDFKAVCDSLSREGLFLTLGYNTAIFNLMQRVKGQVNLFNMDGIEWRRQKWGVIAKTWFWINERIGCWSGNHLVADHPNIKAHLETRVNSEKISMIPYGADELLSADVSCLKPYGLKPGEFSIVIARPEPENSILEMVRAFSRKHRDHKLVVLGNYRPDSSHYDRKVMEAASDEVIFPGAIYDMSVVNALRYYCRFYMHGHRVGGTNPSLVEALGAGSAVIAHDNHFNRWVADKGASYFEDESSCADLISFLLSDNSAVNTMKLESRKRFQERFMWQNVLSEYEKLLCQWSHGN